MCTRYAETQCCVCRRYLDQSSNRIIVEICGHKKCRECFIKEEDGCSVCTQSKQQATINEQNASNRLDDIRHDDVDSTKEPASNPQLVEISEDASHIITTNENGDAVRYKCTICQKSFKSRNNRKYHLFCDKKRSKPFQCKQCDKQFITLAHMNYHQSTHSADKNFVCSHCQKVYSGEIALKKHIKKHQNEFKHKCSQCDEKFLYKEQLNIHENRHNNIFHKCPECGKRFLIKSNLTKHIQSHSGLNRKICHICKHTFSGNSALKTHMLTHSKLKPHQCEKCSKKFIDQRTLERHWKTHFDNALYECTLCSAKSGRKDNIRRHVRNLHSESDEGLQLILEKIFDNFERKKNQATDSIVTREKTEKCTSVSAEEPKCKNETYPVEVVRNIATSVIKFVGRTTEVESTQRRESECSSIADRTPSIVIDDSEEASQQDYMEQRQHTSTTIETNSLDSLAEVGVNLPSLDLPCPDITPLPLINTNTNLTVYRQLLSPYLRKQTNPNTTSVSHDSVNKHSKPSSATVTVRDRPPKKMIEQYEIFRS